MNIVEKSCFARDHAFALHLGTPFAPLTPLTTVLAYKVLCQDDHIQAPIRVCP